MTQLNVIPFQFDTLEIRTLLINDQPWFVAMDVASALMYTDAQAMTRRLDDDEIQNRQIVGFGPRGVALINESGLYSAILRSRKSEAKRFKKWVTAEVLPEIRRTGRYDISDKTLGTDGLQILHDLIGKKIKILPKTVQRQARAKLWSMMHTRFNVSRAELIPAEELSNACNFVAAYVLEGEWIGSTSSNTLPLDEADRTNLNTLCDHAIKIRDLYRHYHLYDALSQLGSPAGRALYGHITDSAAIANRYQPRLQAQLS